MGSHRSDPEATAWRPPHAIRRSRPRIPAPLVHVALFALTFATTSAAGAFAEGLDPFTDPTALQAGFPFSIALMTILLAHEMGHYGFARYHRVPATLPYFIPGLPVFIGTFGAFIRLRSLPTNRRALFDIGAAGPWAGLIVAVPAIVWGLTLSEIRPESTGAIGLIRGDTVAFLFEGGLVFGDSLLFRLLTHLTLGVSPDAVSMHPIAFAGWFGLFITFLNLLPVGQLDGGHVMYALFGARHRLVSRLALLLLLALGFLTRYEGWFFFAIFVSVLGVDHPPTADPVTPLDRKRRVLAWLTIAVFLLTFMRVPVNVVPPAMRFDAPGLEAGSRLLGGETVATGLRYGSP